MVRRKMDKTTNKVQHTTVGDEINYFVNGVNKIGIVVKMSGSYITMFNNDKYDTVHIDETFFVKDIIGKNKSWNDMSFEERSEELYKIKAYSPRFLGKSWEQLPPELKEVLLKSNLENGSYGSIGGSPNVGISTNINFDADKDYEGHSHDDKSKEFKHDEIKPSIKKDGIGNGMVSSTDSGMYNTKYGENGRVNDQEKDKKC